ncbi:MAG: cobalamin-binding protein [Bacteriovorax sp.]|nr:cobalamin-binding protein [Bacteriovorax sp.]
MSKNYFAKRIICLTEESVEFFHAIGRSDLIVGVSVYAVRPPEVKNHPVISAFTHANIKKIIGLKPDLVIGFSDIQKDIARDLIGEGINVYISNQRSLDEILAYLWSLGHMVGEGEKTKEFLLELEEKMKWAASVASNFKKHPKVFIEEWDEPKIVGIRWFSELVELCGGIDIFRERSHAGGLASERLVNSEEVVAANPDIILACWCGKKVDIDSIKARPNYSEISGVKNGQVIELLPEIFLQPGPALFLDGIDQLISIFSNYQIK